METSDDAIVKNAQERVHYALDEFRFSFSHLITGIEIDKIEPEDKWVFNMCRDYVNESAGRRAVPDGEEPVDISVDIGLTSMTRKYLEGWEKKWNKEIQKVEDIIFALSLNPAKKNLIGEIEEMLERWKKMLGNSKQLLVKYFVSDDDKPVEEVSMSEKERQREERRKRMAKFQGEG